MRTGAHELEELLAHGPWVRALASSLVRDSTKADDLVQQAWLRALQSPPAQDRPPRRWFAAVLRNLARAEQRSAARREERERFAGARGPESPADALEATLELARKLAEAVGQLEEPYKSAIFRRYYEGLTPRRIAELDRIPLATVKSRLARGLEKLRERLDRLHDGRRDGWVAACLPLLRDSKTRLLLGGIAMNLKLVGLAAGLVLIGAWAVLRDGAGSSPVQPVAAGAFEAPPTAALDSTAEATAGTRNAAHASVATGAAPAPAVCPFPYPKIELAGRVVDPHGLPLADVRLFLVKPEQALTLRLPGARPGDFATVATSGADGRFKLQPLVEVNILMGERAGLVTLLACDTWSTDGSKELLVVMAPPIDVAGVVVDAEDHAVEAAEVRVAAGEEVRAALGIPSDTAVEVPWRVRSDEQGRFALEDVPGVAQATLCAAHPRHTNASITLPESSKRDLRLVLAGREVKLLSGEVRGPDGQPVPDALVGMAQMSTRTDAQGRFLIELDPLFPGMKERLHSKVLGATKRGRLPAHMHEPEGGWPEFVTLVLGGEPLSIRGKLFDADGKPAAGIEVRVANDHLLGMVCSGVGDFYYPRTLEGIARGSDEMETPASSDRNGEFVLHGLLDRDYVLRAFDPRSLRTVESPPLRAGLQSAELRFPAESGRERVAGRVLSLGGAPLPGVLLVPSLGALQGEMRHTNAEGRFDFGVIATEGLAVQVMGAGFQPLMGWKAPEGGNLAELEVRLARRCQLQVDLADRPALADSVLVLDGQGRRLELWVEERNTSSFALTQPIRDGKSEVLLVAENAEQVVLHKNGVEVERQPVRLRPEGLVSVRF